MLTRQRILLRFLAHAGRPLRRIEAVKWAFLLREESVSGGGNAFYEFLPYHYGPYSFALYHEAAVLAERGYMREVGDHEWEITELGASEAAVLASDLRGDVDRVVARFVDKSEGDLIEYVYSRNPKYTVNSRIRQLASRPVRNAGVYMAGYERLSIDGFLDALMQFGIRRIVDVRANPVARRYGFHKSTMSRISANVGIEYLHVPELGIPSGLRRNLESLEDYEQLFGEYEKTILPAQTEALAAVSAMLAEKPSALVCMEADPRYCHRMRIARAIAGATGAKVIDVRSAA
jgi:uncharacterized protein (DUF488 family)